MSTESDENPSLRPAALGRPVGSSGEQTRRRILEATVRCVGTVGFARATIRDIAREAGMTSGPLYHYFPNKSELIMAAAEYVTAMVKPRFIAATRRPGSIVERLEALLGESDQLIREYPHLAAFDHAIRVESPQWMNLREATATVYQTVQELVVEIVNDAKRDGTLADDVDAEGVSGAIFALILGLAELAATTSEDSHHLTIGAAKSLIHGSLFNTAKTRTKR